MDKGPGLRDEDIRFVITHSEMSIVEMFVLITRALKWPVKRQAISLGYSERQIARIIRNLQDDYDELQIKYSRKLPIRNTESETEKFLDEN